MQHVIKRCDGERVAYECMRPRVCGAHVRVAAPEERDQHFLLKTSSIDIPERLNNFHARQHADS